MIKKAYHYFYYKIYKSIEFTSNEIGGSFLIDWKATLVVDVLIYFIVSASLIYYTIFFDRNIHLNQSNTDVFIIAIPIFLLNYFVFHHQNKWKNIIISFDQLPQKKNVIGGWIVFIIIVFIIGNLIYSFYLMSLIDWSKYP
ncbi:hypothetical protein VUJ46_02575 [Chryseobacterium sp. MYb264]|uniref:hypothetical protein n=1 Tax=Chryseobacterium sp. MYb264 TaxID=2745153 RepID=UPI002E11920D|nr:hypothetical protein VUJ46_02575 [Chryseobacterium sp. MYb264]